MIRLAVVVEGQTEEDFVNRVLAPHLRTHGVEPTPSLIGKGNGGGGNVTVGRLASEMTRWFWSHSRVFGELLDRPPGLIEKLKAIRSKFETPEDINDGCTTHPSKRIEDLMPTYQKRVNGPFLADRMGLHAIRAECPRFNQWVERLESLDQRGVSQ